jgi:hypothetical protein
MPPRAVQLYMQTARFTTVSANDFASTTTTVYKLSVSAGARGDQIRGHHDLQIGRPVDYGVIEARIRDKRKDTYHREMLAKKEAKKAKVSKPTKKTREHPQRQQEEQNAKFKANLIRACNGDERCSRS